MCTYTCVYSYGYVYACMHIYMHVRTQIYLCTQVGMYVYVYMCNVYVVMHARLSFDKNTSSVYACICIHM
jgi:hypothetical protein